MVKFKTGGQEVQSPESPPAVPEQSAVFLDRVPSNWEIRATGTGISARNNVSGEAFEGEIAEFNRRLRG